MNRESPNQPSNDQNGSASAPNRLFIRLMIIAALVSIGTGIYATIGDQLNLNSLAARESELRSFQAANPILVYGIAFLIYVVSTGLSLPGATALSLLFAWYFGFLPALILISFASTAGATIAFVLSRYLFRDSLQNRFGDRLKAFNAALDREGAFYLFSLRLIPAVPFFVINLVMGLTTLRATTFWWVSQIGMLPGTAAYVYAGSQFPDLKTLADKGASGILSPQLFAAFAILGLLPLVLRKFLQRFREPERKI